MASPLERIGRALGSFLNQPIKNSNALPAPNFDLLSATLRPADVLLVEGNSRVSTAIKYLTQSTWSHAALYVGRGAGLRDKLGRLCELIEADIVEGIRAVPLLEFAGLQCRICRPRGLTPADEAQVVNFAVERIGNLYDLKNIFDLARYLIPTPPVATSWRRHMLALGSGDPTRAICSSLIAQAFQSVRYPILPYQEEDASDAGSNHPGNKMIMHIRHHSLFVPRDFDVSPYFDVIKPPLSAGFDFRSLSWSR